MIDNTKNTAICFASGLGAGIIAAGMRQKQWGDIASHVALFESQNVTKPQLEYLVKKYENAVFAYMRSVGGIGPTEKVELVARIIDAKIANDYKLLVKFFDKAGNYKCEYDCVPDRDVFRKGLELIQNGQASPLKLGLAVAAGVTALAFAIKAAISD